MSERVQLHNARRTTNFVAIVVDEPSPDIKNSALLFKLNNCFIVVKLIKLILPMIQCTACLGLRAGKEAEGGDGAEDEGAGAGTVSRTPG